ncbi:Hypothetical protein CINCED_3A008177 [Cinara cedri]|uniref:Uncharacterized protein n=1 Tax=Cinara cedri TaxID=506608 RepID=A0A5E4NKC1_9HEMI|nr:Hypothetical protein CINCED_3A008177 [Cinara cedri]
MAADLPWNEDWRRGERGVMCTKNGREGGRKRKRCANRLKAEVYARKMRDYKNENAMSLTKDLLCVVTIVSAPVVCSFFIFRPSVLGPILSISPDIGRKGFDRNPPRTAVHLMPESAMNIRARATARPRSLLFSGE